jgi:cytoskeletal protein RodZ
VLTAAATLCLAAAGTIAVTWTAPSASPDQATGMLSFHSLIRPPHAGTALQPAQVSLADQAVVNAAADQAAAAYAAAAMAARFAVALAAHEAHQAHVAHAAHAVAMQGMVTELANAQAADQQGAVQQVATETAVQQAPAGAPQRIAGQMLAQDGWAGQFSCLDALWAQESGWNVYAENPSSGAYGIAQALPGSKMASAGPDWQSNAVTQISWGLAYIRATYGWPCAAWDHEEATGWY